MSIRLVAMAHPFTTERTISEIEPQSIQSILESVQPVKELQFARVLINDEVITEDHYDRIPEDGDTVIVRVIPMGGNPTGTSTGMKVGGALLAIIGAVLLFTGVGAYLGLSLIGVGAEMWLGGAAIQYGWFLPSAPSSLGPSTSAPSIRGGRNSANPGGDMPIILGKHLITPPYGSGFYTTFSEVDGTTTITAGGGGSSNNTSSTAGSGSRDPNWDPPSQR